MSNGARHGLGVLAGVIATPLVGAGLVVGFERLEEHRRHFVRLDSTTTSTGLVAGAVLALTAAAIAVLVASRLSPLASFIPGAVFTVYGVVWLTKPAWASRQVTDLPDRYVIPVINMSIFAVPFLVGVVLLAASILPSRWRARTPAAGSRQPAGPPPPGMPGGPPPHAAMPGPPSPMYGREQQQPYGRGQSQTPSPYGQPPGPAPSASPSASPGPGGIPVPRPAQGPPSPQAPPPPPPPPKPSQSSQSSEDDEPGEWTRMYGGDDLKDGGSSR